MCVPFCCESASLCINFLYGKEDEYKALVDSGGGEEMVESEEKRKGGRGAVMTKPLKEMARFEFDGKDETPRRHHFPNHFLSFGIFPSSFVPETWTHLI